MAEWTTLSYETRLIILNMVFARLSAPEEHQPAGRLLRRTPGLIPSHALVCRDWFEFFERETYRNIFVTQASLENIRRLNRRQQSLVRYLWVKVDLATYDCPDCVGYSSESSEKLPKYNAALVEDAIKRTFHILRSWDTEQRPGAPGLSLEISACSPSDMEHAFCNDLHFDTSPFDVHGPLERNRPEISHPGHGWLQGRRTGPPSLPSINLAGGFLSCTVDGLPAVPAVTSFIVRRQTRWQLEPATLARILQRLPCLRRVLIESWRPFQWCPFRNGYPDDLGRCRSRSPSFHLATSSSSFFWGSLVTAGR